MAEHEIRHVKLRGLSALAVVAIAVAACSGGGATPAPTTAPTATPAGSPDASPSGSASPEAALAEVCEAGTAEGKLVHWHNHSEEYVKVIELFNETYPDIEVELLELSPDEATQRILTEVAANRQPSADLLALGLDVAVPLLDRGELVTDQDWAALGVPEDVIHETGQLRKQRTSVGLGYNTDKLSEADLPTTWEELIDAKWAGRVIVDPRGRPFDALSLAWGEEKTLDYVQRLKDTVQPLVIEGGTAGLVAVAGGEADISTSGRSAEMLEQQAEGAPVAMRYLDVVATIDNYNMVLKNAAHVNAAKCFAAWFSIDGQELYNEVEFKSNEAIPEGTPDGAELVTIETPEQADAVKAIGKKIGQIWTGG